MHRLIRSLAAGAAVAALASFAPMASATVLNFDDIGSYGFVPAGYGGLDWSASSWIAFSGEQAPFTPHSGTWRIATDFGSNDAASTIRFAKPSVFNGAWFSGYDDSSVSFLLYLGGKLVASSSTLSTSITPAFLASGYAGLADVVVVASGQQANYALDDFSFNEVAPAVPEPATWALMFAGLGVVAALARRRRA